VGALRRTGCIFRLLEREFLADIVMREKGSVLEIGPFCKPMLKGDNVAYLDIYTSEELRERSGQHGLDATNCPDRIDFVGDIDSVDREFDSVISSHSIEHQPDLLHHLKNVERILPVGGRYYILIPDHRYCFDAFQRESTIGDVIQAHEEQRVRHTLSNIIAHRTLSVHNDHNEHWRGNSGAISTDMIYAGTVAAINEYRAAAGEYIDVHAWFFTPEGFHRIIDILNRLGVLGLSPVRVYSTPKNRNEFCAVLEKMIV
jgi:SAM-dependent methyltransferase